MTKRLLPVVRLSIPYNCELVVPQTNCSSLASYAVTFWALGVVSSYTEVPTVLEGLDCQLPRMVANVCAEDGETARERATGWPKMPLTGSWRLKLESGVNEGSE